MPVGNIFISYSTKDMVFAKRIAQSVNSWGYSVWMAPDMIPAGSSYAKEIPSAIQNASAMILLLSANSMNSIWVEKEVDHALTNRKTIFPVQLDQAVVNGTFQFYLSNVQIISYRQELSEQLAELQKEMDATLALNVQRVEAPMMQKGTIKPGTRGTRSTNSLRVNRIPITCERCGSSMLRNTKIGTYECVSCGHLNYDDFQKIRNYLAIVGQAPAAIIEANTGVPKSTIDYLFKEEFLEIPYYCDVRASCKNCGAPIRSGELCESCKNRTVIDTKKKDKWHSYI